VKSTKCKTKGTNEREKMSSSKRKRKAEREHIIKILNVSIKEKGLRLIKTDGTPITSAEELLSLPTKVGPGGYVYYDVVYMEPHSNN
jgi:hypothetical protein